MITRARFFLLGFGLLAVAPLLLWTGTGKAVATVPSSPTCWDASCYRTNAQIDSFLHTIAASYPQIASLHDEGLSWEGTRHLWLLHITSNSRPGPKPAIFMVAGQQARDVTTPEM